MRVFPKFYLSTYFFIAAIFVVCIFSTTLLCPLARGQEATGTTAIGPHPLITQAVDETQLTTLTGNTYPLAKPEYDLGTAPASLPMERMLLVLKRSSEQEFALRKLLDDHQDKASPSYHKWLTPEEVGQQFGPTDTDMQTITAWLQSHGFQVGSTKGRTVVEFSGSASQVQEAFHTTIHKYLVNGEQHWANASDPQIPTALTPAVAGIDSLHNFPRKAMNRFVGTYSERTKSLTVPGPNYTVACGSGQTCYAVSPYDFATIYDVLPLWNATPAINGTGETIAIVGRTNINPNDPSTFWTLFGLTVPTNKLNIILNGPDPGINGDEGEADIDVQWSGAVAPQATIDFVTSQSTETADGVDLSAVYIVDNNLAPVMSESYGECELGLGTAGNQFYYTLWEQAAAQGISVFVSSGDNGAAGCDNPGGPAQYGLNVNGIASTPFNAAVGGTDFNQYQSQATYWNPSNGANEESAKGYIPEVAWNNSCTNPWALTAGLGSTAEQVCNNAQLNPFFLNSTGGSGGPSNCVVNTQGVIGSCTQRYPKPSWQTGANVPNDSSRDLPDVSLFASNGVLTGSFYIVCQSDQTGGCSLNAFAGYGGTSVASPAFAGIMSLANQKMGVPQGVPGFALYQLATKQTNAFHDVPTSSTIAMPCFTNTPNCTTKTAGDAYGVLSSSGQMAYSTGTGYDLATGLGSVDAANLVDNWSKATFTATSTALTLGTGGKAVNVTHGTAVPVSIDVSPTAATGAASLLVSNQTGTTIGQGIDGFTLTNGATASGAATSLLPGGTNYVIAHYSGDGTYGGSYSTPQLVTVTAEPSTVVPTMLPAGTGTTVSYDAQYYLRMDVENSKGETCVPSPFGEVACPTGTITVTDNGNAFGSGGTFPLNGEGYAETTSQPVALTGGNHTLITQYSGDSNYKSNSGQLAVIVNKAPTSAQQPYVQATNFTQPVTMTTSVGDGNAAAYDAVPTGTVTFYSNGTAIPGTPTYGTNGPLTLYAALTTSTFFTQPGTYTITASYSGDQNYAASTSPGNQLVLTYPTPTVSLNPASQTVVSGGNATLTTLVDTTNKNIYPTGTVTFVNQATGASVSGPTACTNATDPSGNYACQVVATFPVTASESVYSQYSGDTNYPGSISSTTSTIVVPDFSLGPASGTVTVSQGQSQQVAINISALNGFTGAVGNFSCSGLPAETSCGFSPATVPGGSGSTTLTITTTPLGQSGQFRRRAANENHGAGWMATSLLSLLGVCLIGIPAWGRRRRALPVLMMAALLMLLPSCGGGSGGGGGPPPNPVPSISSLSPTQQAAGSQSQTLTITGSNFMSSSTATYNASPRTATYTSPTQLSISLTANDLAATGTFPVVVTNPAPGGGASNSVNFNVTTGTPTGSFTVTVTATSSTLSHNTSFTLVVQ